MPDDGAGVLTGSQGRQDQNGGSSPPVCRGRWYRSRMMLLDASTAIIVLERQAQINRGHI